MRHFPLSPPEMGEASIGVVQMGTLPAIALTLVILVRQPCKPRI